MTTNNVSVKVIKISLYKLIIIGDSWYRHKKFLMRLINYHIGKGA